MPRRVLFVATALLVGLIAACGPQKPYSDSVFFGTCIMPFGTDPCDSDMDICKTYQGVFTATYADAKACSTACDRISLDPDNVYTGRNCGYMLIYGGNLCSQQCLRLYPKQN